MRTQLFGNKGVQQADHYKVSFFYIFFIFILYIIYLYYILLYYVLLGVVAVAIAEQLSYDDRIDHAARVIMTPSLVLIWSFTDPIHPQV